MTRKMKDSGIEWIGEIPEEWEVVKLKYLGEFSSSGIDKKINENEKLIKIVNYTDVYNNWQFRLYNMDYMIVSANSDQIKQHLLKRGDLIFTPSSETIEDIGISAVVMEDLINTAFSYHVLRYKFNSSEKVIFEYRRYLCNNNYSYNYFSFLAKGTTRKTLKRSDFNEAKVVLPPLKTQEKISVFLDNKMADTENIKSAIIKEIETLENYKKSMITEAVTKGLDKNVEMKDSGIEWIGEIPKHWSVKQLKYVMNNLNYQRVPVDASKRNNTSEKLYDYYGATGVIDKIDGYTTVGSNILIGEDGANLIFRNLPLIYIAEGKYWVNNHAHILHPKDGNLDFFAYQMEIIDYRNYITGAAQPKLNLENLKKVKLVCPTQKDQNEIANYLNKKTKLINDSIAIKQKQLETLEEYKKSLIYEYVTGKKEVKDGEES